jgi:AcrR family transcriptional regulator
VPATAEGTEHVERRLGRPRDAGADEAILQAVLDLVAETGLPNLSMDAVAARAGVGKATIYRRWPSKGVLVVEAWRSLIAPVETPDTGSLRGDLLVLLTAVTAKAGTTAFDVLIQVAAAARTEPELAASLREYVACRRGPMREVLLRAQARGELRNDVDLDALQDAVVGPLFYRLLFGHAPIDAAFAEHVVDVVLAGNLT